ncbi:MAG: hypothetical protein OXC11_13400 [Rhodospirillales bacterium]|nr:hypothetical protein [Rhodospirillales bacterium]
MAGGLRESPWGRLPAGDVDREADIMEIEAEMDRVDGGAGGDSREAALQALERVFAVLRELVEVYLGVMEG